MKILSNQNLNPIKILILSLIIGVSGNYIFAAWTPAPANPPSGNIDAPLNVGVSGQAKAGGLTLGTNCVSPCVNGLIVDKGNVGIGTTTPNVPLVVKGQARLIREGTIVDNLPFLAVESYASGSTESTGSGVHLMRARGTINSRTPLLSGDRIGGLYATGYDHTGGSDFYSGGNANSAAIQFIANENFNTDNHGTRIQFESTPNLANTRTVAMTIAGANVGIGTATPDVPLMVKGETRFIREGAIEESVPFFGVESYSDGATESTGSGIHLMRSRGTITSRLPLASGDRIGGLYATGYDHTGGSNYYTNGNANTAAIQFMATQAYTANAHGSKIQFENTKNGTKTRNLNMVIDEDGKVGVGVSDPAVKLDVAGIIKIATEADRPACSSSTQGMISYNAGTTGNFGFYGCMHNVATSTWGWVKLNN